MKNKSIFKCFINPVILSAFLITLLAGCVKPEFSPLLQNQGGLVLDESISRWSFLPNGQSSAIPIQPGKGLLSQVPWNVPCCNGKYVVVVDTSNLIHGKENSDAQLGILFPPLGGVIEFIEINGRKVSVVQKNYSNSGPIISLTQKEMKSNLIKIQLKLTSVRDFHAGMWIGKPILGRTNDLIELHNQRVIHQTVIPLVYSITCFIISTVFLSLIFLTKSKDKIYFEFMLCLTAWALFYLFLSGLIRTESTYWGRLLFFPARTFACLATIRLIGTLGRVQVSHLNVFSFFCGLLILSQIVFNSLGFYWMPEVSLPILVIPMAGVIIKLAFNAKAQVKKVFLLATALNFICFFSDSIKHFSILFHFEYDLPFFERYSAAILLLISLVYLVSQLAQEVVKSLKKEAFEEAAAQFVHDIQAPVAALRMATQIILNSPHEASVIISSAVKRIFEICKSLKYFYKEKQGPTRQSLKYLIDSLVEEKRVLNLNNQVKIELHYDNQAIESFVNVQPMELCRVLSNLVDNSREAIGESGLIQINVRCKNKQVWVEVSDNGRGISSMQMKNIGKKGISFGKPKGSGLGLYHAKKMIQSWEGNVKINSQAGVGTSVTIILPECVEQ
jgi:signal transduction histidine kinase